MSVRFVAKINDAARSFVPGPGKLSTKRIHPIRTFFIAVQTFPTRLIARTKNEDGHALRGGALR